MQVQGDPSDGPNASGASWWRRLLECIPVKRRPAPESQRNQSQDSGIQGDGQSYRFPSQTESDRAGAAVEHLGSDECRQQLTYSKLPTSSTEPEREPEALVEELAEIAYDSASCQLDIDELDVIKQLTEVRKVAHVDLQLLRQSPDGVKLLKFYPKDHRGEALLPSVVKVADTHKILAEVKDPVLDEEIWGDCFPRIRDVQTRAKKAALHLELSGGTFVFPNCAETFDGLQDFAQFFHTAATAGGQDAYKVQSSAILAGQEVVERIILRCTMMRRSSLTLTDMDLLAAFGNVGKLVLGEGDNQFGPSYFDGEAAEDKTAEELHGSLLRDNVGPEVLQQVVEHIVGRLQKPSEFFQDFAERMAKLPEDDKVRRFRAVEGTTHNALHPGNILRSSDGILWVLETQSTEAGHHTLEDVVRWLAALLLLHTPFQKDTADEVHLQELVLIIASIPEDLEPDPPDPPSGASLLVRFVWHFLLGSIRDLRKFMSVEGEQSERPGLQLVWLLFHFALQMVPSPHTKAFPERKRLALFAGVALGARLMAEASNEKPVWLLKDMKKWGAVQQPESARSSSMQLRGRFRSPREPPAVEPQLQLKVSDEILESREIRRYLAAASGKEVWSRDPLTQEYFSVLDMAVPLQLQGKNEAVGGHQELFRTFSRTPRLVVHGPPGAGKTIFTKQLVAFAGKEHVELGSREHLPLRVPFFKLAEIAAMPHVDATDLLTSFMEQAFDSFTQGFLQMIRERCGLLLILDGLDEVAESAAIMQWLTRFLEAEENHHHWVLITTSSSAMDDNFRRKIRENDFTELKLLPLDEPQLESLCVRTVKEPTQRQRILSSLLKPDHWEWVQPPLMASMAIRMLSLTLGHVSLDRFRHADVYGFAYEQLLRQLHHSKLRSAGEFGSIQAALTQLPRGLPLLALKLQERKTREATESIFQEVGKEIDNEPLMTAVWRLAKRGQVQQIETGINSVRFFHSSMQEYLAATCAWQRVEATPGQHFPSWMLQSSGSVDAWVSGICRFAGYIAADRQGQLHRERFRDIKWDLGDILHTICRHSADKEAIECLLQLTAESRQRVMLVNSKDSSGNTPLHNAARAGQIAIVRTLLSSITAPSDRLELLTVPDSTGGTVLQEAVQAGSEETVRAVLEALPGPKERRTLLDVRGTIGQTPLLTAATRGHEAVVEALLGAIGDPQECSFYLEAKSAQGYTALQLAARDGQKGAVRALLAAAPGSAERCRLLATADAAGQTALHLAVLPGHNAIVKEILEAVEPGKSDTFASLTTADANGQTVLHHAAVRGYEGILDALLAAAPGAAEKLSLLVAADKTGQTSLHCACVTGHERIVRALLDAAPTPEDRKTFVEVSDQNGQNSMHYAAMRGQEAIMRALLAALPDPSQRSPLLAVPDKHGVTVLHCAAQRGHDGIARAISAAAGSAEQRTALFRAVEQHYGQTALQFAAANGHQAVIRGILEEIPSPAERDALLSNMDKEGRTAVHLAAGKGHTATLKPLLQATSIPEEQAALLAGKDAAGFTPLHTAASGGHTASLQALLASAKELSGCAALLLAATPDGRTALHLSVRAGGDASLESLLEAAAGVNAQEGLLLAATDEGCTALHFAAKGGHDKMIKALVTAAQAAGVLDTLLLTRSKTPDKGFTALHIAASHGQVSTVKALLAAVRDFRRLRSLLAARIDEGLTAYELASDDEVRQILHDPFGVNESAG